MGFGFGVQDMGVVVWGVRCGVWDVGCKTWVLGFRV